MEGVLEVVVLRDGQAPRAVCGCWPVARLWPSGGRATRRGKVDGAPRLDAAGSRRGLVALGAAAACVVEWGGAGQRGARVAFRWLCTGWRSGMPRIRGSVRLLMRGFGFRGSGLGLVWFGGPVGHVAGDEGTVSHVAGDEGVGLHGRQRPAQSWLIVAAYLPATLFTSRATLKTQNHP
jgi:hypothetical protein